MSWNSRHVLVLRRSPSADPLDAEANEIQIAIRHAFPLAIPLGEGTLSATGELDDARSRARWRFDFECLGFNRDGESGMLQSFARLLLLTQKFLVGPPGSTLWIWRALEAGNLSDGPLQRDTYDPADLSSSADAPSFWNLSDEDYQLDGEGYPFDPPGILPIRVVGAKEPSINHEGRGVYTCSFSLFAAMPHTP